MEKGLTLSDNKPEEENQVESWKDSPDDDSDSSVSVDDGREIHPDYEDSSDEEDLRNTIGNIPISWYDDLKHVGYDWEGEKIGKGPTRTQMEEFLAKMEDPDYWRKVKDKQTGKEVILSDEQVQLVSNTLNHRYPEVGYNPYEPFIDFFTHETSIHPVTNRPEHKRSFIPSKLEKQKVGRIVHAIKMGWIKPKKPKQVEDEEPQFYDLWKTENEDPLTKSQKARLKMQIPAPKMALPGHAESYNPPPEYLLTEKEEEEWKEQDPEERGLDFIPQKYDSLRTVPAYSSFIKNRFERCLDLYLAPRQRKMKLNVDPKELLPELPKPLDLQPFPTTLAMIYRGHEGLVRATAVEQSTGQYMASGGEDGVLRIWELHSGRCVRKIYINSMISSVAWCPNSKLTLVLVAAGNKVFAVNPGVGDKVCATDTTGLLDSIEKNRQHSFSSTSSSSVQWFGKTVSDRIGDIRFEIQLQQDVKWVRWHIKGDYFLSVSCEGTGAEAVVVHQLTKTTSKAPLTRNRGAVQCALFHPSKPYLFVATQRHVRMYDLVKRELVKKLFPNCKWISSMAIHPRGDNLIVGSYDCRLTWFDLDLSTKPYKTLRNHKGAVRAVDFHQRQPLFASASDDGSVIVCHGRVYSDLMQNPLIVPVKILHGHTINSSFGVLSCTFHPTQPWIVTSGADSTIRLYTY